MQGNLERHLGKGGQNSCYAAKMRSAYEYGCGILLEAGKLAMVSIIRVEPGVRRLIDLDSDLQE